MGVSSWIGIVITAVGTVLVPWRTHRHNTRPKIYVSTFRKAMWSNPRSGTVYDLGFEIVNQGGVPVILQKLEICDFTFDWVAKVGGVPKSCLMIGSLFDESRKRGKFRPTTLEPGVKFERTLTSDWLEARDLSFELVHGQWLVLTTTVGRIAEKIDIHSYRP